MRGVLKAHTLSVVSDRLVEGRWREGSVLGEVYLNGNVCPCTLTRREFTRICGSANCEGKKRLKDYETADYIDLGDIFIT